MYKDEDFRSEAGSGVRSGVRLAQLHIGVLIVYQTDFKKIIGNEEIG